MCGGQPLGPAGTHSGHSLPIHVLSSQRGPHPLPQRRPLGPAKKLPDRRPQSTACCPMGPSCQLTRA